MQEEKISGWSDLANLADRHKRENWLYRGVTHVHQHAANVKKATQFIVWAAPEED